MLRKFTAAHRTICFLALITLTAFGCVDPQVDAGSRTESQSGTVSAIEDDGSREITFERTDGKKTTLSISDDSGITILRGNTTISPEDLSVADHVLATWSNGRLRVLQVTGE